MLAIDDDPHIHALLSKALANDAENWDLSCAKSPEEALKMAANRSFAVALVDLHYAGSPTSGFALLDHLRELDPRIELVVMSSSSRFEDVRGAMRGGAGDYLPKGFGRGELVHALERAVERRRWKRIEIHTRNNSRAKNLVGGGAGMSAVKKMISRVAPAMAPVLITGETGTGKELVAAAIHGQGRDPAGPFVPVNCAALPASTIDSFFFGHEKGAFTGADRTKPGVFEDAEGGTLFLDEVNSLPLDLQGRLLRVLQENQVRRLGGRRELPVDFRLVAASNQHLESLVKNGQFREDLFFRIGVLRLDIPPLRERLEDLPELLGSFLPGRVVSEPVVKLMLSHHWPGNVRELRNLCQALAVLAPAEGEILLEHLPESALRSFASSPEQLESDLDGFVNEQESREKEFLARAYRSAGGNISSMARMMGVDRSHLHQKLTKLGVHQPRKP